MSRHHQRSLANRRSAENTHKAAERRRLRKRAIKSRTRTLISRVRRPLDAGDVTTAQESLTEALSALDRAASKGAIHPNNAARRKSRLMRAFAKASETARA